MEFYNKKEQLYLEMLWCWSRSKFLQVRHDKQVSRNEAPNNAAL